jgi:hypothetical protein
LHIPQSRPRVPRAAPTHECLVPNYAAIHLNRFEVTVSLLRARGVRPVPRRRYGVIPVTRFALRAWPARASAVLVVGAHHGSIYLQAAHGEPDAGALMWFCGGDLSALTLEVWLAAHLVSRGGSGSGSGCKCGEQQYDICEVR